MLSGQEPCPVQAPDKMRRSRQRPHHPQQTPQCLGLPQQEIIRAIICYPSFVSHFGPTIAAMTDEEFELLRELEKIDHRAIYYQIEAFVPTDTHPAVIRREFEFFRSDCEQAAEFLSTYQVQGRDLDWLKCYSFLDLHNATAGFRNVIQFILFGKLFHGKIEERDVVVRTWDICSLFERRQQKHHVSRFLKTIKFFMEERNDAHECLPKFVGYTIDKKLAVVYDIKARRTLSEELESGHFGWEDRLNAALKLAKLLRWFHSKLYVVGAIDENNILVDEKYNLTFYHFDLLGRIASMASAMPFEDMEWGHHPLFVPFSPEVGWTVKSDVYAYGIVLLLLITKKDVKPEDKQMFLVGSKDRFRLEEQCSLVDGSFNQESGMSFEITKLVLSCLDDEPEKRPYITEVISKLETLLCPQKRESKEEDGETSCQEQDISPEGAREEC